MNRKARSLVIQYLSLSVLTGISSGAIYGTYVIYLTQYGNLSKFEANLVNVVYFFTMFVMEVPTGAFADTYGRKASYVLSLVLVALGTFVYGSTQSFFWFAIAEVIGALGCTFETGAFESWIVDGLIETGEPDTFKKTVAPLEAILDTFATAGGCVLGGYLATLDPRYPWFFRSFGFIVTAILASIYMKEGTLSNYKPEHWKEIIEKAKKGIQASRQNKSVAFILTASFGIVLALKSIDMFWSLRYQNVGTNATGWIALSFQFCMFFGALYARAKSKVKMIEEKTIIFLIIMLGLLAGLAGVIQVPIISLIPFLLYEIPRGAWRPLKSSYLQQGIRDSDTRATVSSCACVFDHLAGALGLLLAGIVGEYIGISASWILSSLILFGTALALKQQ